jgi:hypothetical protein
MIPSFWDIHGYNMCTLQIHSQVSRSALPCEAIYLMGQNIDDFKCKKLAPGGCTVVVTNAR